MQWISNQALLKYTYPYVFRVPALGLELYKFFGHLVVGALRQDSQDCPACLVQIDPATQRAPARAATLLGDVSQLQHGHPDEAILPREAVVLGTDVQLVRVWLVLVSQDAAEQNYISGLDNIFVSLGRRFR